MNGVVVTGLGVVSPHGEDARGTGADAGRAGWGTGCDATHLTQPDPDCGLHLVSPAATAAPRLRAAISNSFAFGGSNAALVFTRA